MLELTYYLEGGQPVLLKGGLPYTKPRDSVGFAFDDSDKDKIILHKHGDPDVVRAWVAESKTKLLASGDPVSTGLANDIKFIEISAFPRGFPVMLVNEAIAGIQKARRELFCPQDTIDVEAVVLDDQRLIA